jgi:parallel beta-helix repeat protein
MDVHITNNEFPDIGIGMYVFGLENGVISNNSLLNNTSTIMYGIYIENVTISDNIFDHSDYYSVWIDTADHCRFERNEFKNSTFGLMGYSITNTRFIDNSLDCSYISIAIEGFRNITMAGNRMWNSSIHLIDRTEDYRTLSVHPNNEVNDLPLLYIRDSDLQGEEIEGDAGYILLVNVSRARISERTIRNTFSPINLIGCEDVTVSDCDLDHNTGILYARECNDLKVERLTASSLVNGFHFEKVTNSTVLRNDITSSYDPIALISSNHVTIRRNEFRARQGMPKIRFSDDNIIRDNVFHSGLTFRFSYRNTIESNEFNGMGLVIPDDLLWDPAQPEPRNNIVNGIRQDYILNKIDEDIEIPAGSKHLIFFNLTRCSIPKYEIDNGEGLVIKECSDLTLRDWKLESCFSGIKISRSFRINVVDCRITGSGIGSGAGMILHESTACRIEGNMIEEGGGIALNSCTGPMVHENEIRGMISNGIYIWNRTSEFLIIRNEINGSRLQGIIVENSWDGLISGNRIMGNGEYAIYCTRSSQRNLIYNNHFIENNGASDSYKDYSRQAYDIGADNSWYYEAPDVTIGNYWSDMQGPDDNDDGIADPEYYLDGFEGKYDLYPMIEGHEPEDDIAGMKIGEIWLTFILIGLILGIVMMVAWKAMNPKN